MREILLASTLLCASCGEDLPAESPRVGEPTLDVAAFDEPVLLAGEPFPVEIAWDYACELVPGVTASCCRRFDTEVTCQGSTCAVDAVFEGGCGATFDVIPRGATDAFRLFVDVTDVENGDHRELVLGPAPVRVLDAIELPCRVETLDGDLVPCSYSVPSGSAIELATIGHAGELALDLRQPPTSNLGRPSCTYQSWSTPPGDGCVWWNVPPGTFTATVVHDDLEATVTLTVE